uniref:Uncharacterized protein n=1 Tax=uncultured Chromatiales bacterium HF0200_41F04 TaxID=710740 RepID=E0XV06_9GAMM|nr:hypothetical protein [uncultured Chromatiales bacterium HF0200_41F04]
MSILLLASECTSSYRLRLRRDLIEGFSGRYPGGFSVVDHFPMIVKQTTASSTPEMPPPF